jgi:geranylgeranylglycerol-phosphate geranylgeranyltransferase
MKSNSYPSSDARTIGDYQPLTMIARARILASLFRVGNSALLGSLAVFSVIVTGPGGSWTLLHLSLVFTSWTALAATAYAVNDLIDRVADRVNRPARYLQRVERSPFWILASVCTAALTALVAGAFVPIERFLILETAWACCAIGYSFGLKRRSGLLANLLSALCVTASAMPGLLQGFSTRLTAFLPVLFLLILAREIWKDIEDEAGDTAAGLRTLPVLRGSTFAGRSASIVSAAAFSVLILNRPSAANVEIIAICIGVTGLIASALLFARPQIMRASGIQRLHRYTAILVFALFVVGSGLV